jgi:two-component system chemotaxis response regulator CheY
MLFLELDRYNLTIFSVCVRKLKMTDKKLKIMTVDDSELIRKSLSHIVKKNIPNHEMLQAENGVEALKVLQEHKDVNIMFLDWNMPLMQGDQVVEEVRKIPELNHMRIIMVTTESHKDKLQKVLRAGANGFVVKPFVMTQMQKVLKQVVGRL